MTNPSAQADCTVAELSERRNRGETVAVLDVRTAEEWAIAHVDGTIDIPMQEIATRVDELEEYRDRELVVMCHHGGRSARVAGWLRQQGFTQVRNLLGGINAWAEQIDPTVEKY